MRTKRVLTEKQETWLARIAARPDIAGNTAMLMSAGSRGRALVSVKFRPVEQDALHARIRMLIEQLMGRAVSSNEQLGKGLGFRRESLPSLIQHVARGLNDTPKVLDGGLPLPTDLDAFLSITVRGFRVWVIDQL